MQRKTKLLLPFILLIYFVAASSFKLRLDELDTAIVYLNGKLVGTWEGTVNQVVHIDNIKDGDTLTVRVRTDVGGLGNSSIDVKDDNGLLIENVESPRSREEAATFVYVLNLKKIDVNKVQSLQVFLNVDPERHLAPPTIATITMNKK